MSYREPQFQDEPADYDEEEIVIDPSAEFTGPIQGMEELKEREEKEARRARRRAERRRQRDLRTGKIVAACLCVCIVIAVIITFSVLKGVERYIEYGPGGEPHHSSTQNVTGEDDNGNDETSVPLPSTPGSPTNSTGGTSSEPSPNNPGDNSNVQGQSATANEQNAQTETVAPTKAPTPSPTVPATPRPTAPLQESYVFEPVKDTFVYVDGPDTTKFYGSEESFLVQLGTKVERPGAPLERATAKAIVQFDTGMLPDRSVWPVVNDSEEATSVQPLDATLKIHHIAFKDREDLQNQPNADVESRTPVRMEVWRLPNTINPDLNIETWTGDAFAATPKGDRTGYLVTTQEVGPDDGWLEIDLHDAIFVPDRVNNDLAYTDEKIILLLSIWPGDSANKQLSVIGDRFHSREAVDDGFSPQLIINNMI
eukprot:CAMPEP_0113454872 /NCGR_PEP_ID=MMETSP0014_2-20120614/8087_1 /TAXON_ID=2857 /ORGANISM="Nitzschia sp." /LENGTH=424 /DNA_ID=CAMNT_0000346291 /DNA_START=44 /DNA_END=1318 /DNA_ORIENTATION=+ /assembly_acc=CAM_ASM_000159